MYRYKWMWFKSKRGNFVNAKNRPMTAYEEILVFSHGTTANGSKNKMVYFPQGLIEKHTVRRDMNGKRFGTMAGKRPSHKPVIVSEYTNYPFDVLQFDSVKKPRHSTEKPVPLLEYLIRTYSQPEEIILDNCMGIGSTILAAIKSNRHYIGIELDSNYFNIAIDSVKKS